MHHLTYFGCFIDKIQIHVKNLPIALSSGNHSIQLFVDLNSGPPYAITAATAKCCVIYKFHTVPCVPKKLIVQLSSTVFRLVCIAQSTIRVNLNIKSCFTSVFKRFFLNLYFVSSCWQQCHTLKCGLCTTKTKNAPLHSTQTRRFTSICECRFTI